MQNNAEAIYVTRSGQTTLNDLILLDKHVPDFGMKKLFVSGNENTERYLDMLPHFGCFPVDNYQQIKSMYNYSLCNLDYPSVLTPLTFQNSLFERYQCDRYAPVVTVRNGSFTAIQLFGSLFFKEAFWMLPLNEDFDNIQWNVIVQYVLWMMGGHVSIFHGKNELISYPKTKLATDSAFIQNLKQLECLPKETTTSQCVRIILLGMSKWKILPPRAIELLRKWFFQLDEKLPFYIEFSKESEKCSITNILYQPVRKQAPINDNYKYQVSNKSESVNKIQNMCLKHISRPALTNIVNTMQHNDKQFHDMLLIIIFNNAHYNVIPYMEILLRSFYPNILYCGPDHPGSSTSFSFVSYANTPSGYRNGSFNYECIVHAYSMFPYMPGGYFVTGDDLMLLPHLFRQLSNEKLWFVPRNTRFVVDFVRKCPIYRGECDSDTWVPPELTSLWFVEYPKEAKSIMVALHKQAKQSSTFRR